MKNLKKLKIIIKKEYIFTDATYSLKFGKENESYMFLEDLKKDLIEKIKKL